MQQMDGGRYELHVLTAQEVLDAQFSMSRLRKGYDQEEVDEFLDRVIAALERYEDLSVSWRELAKAQRLGVIRRQERIRAAAETGRTILADDDAVDQITTLLEGDVKADLRAELARIIKATGREVSD